MTIEYISKTGFVLHGPPYTKEEEAAFYKRIGKIKSLTVASSPPSERKAQQPKAQESPYALGQAHT